MKRIRLVTLSVSILFGGLPGAFPVSAQQGMGMHRGMRHYNPATETTVTGTVEKVSQYQAGTHVLLKSGKETLDVRLGPSSFLAQKHFTISKGDQIEVTGSEVKYNGTEVLLAREVKKGTEVLTLRNTNGMPMWSRQAGSSMGPGRMMGAGQGMGQNMGSMGGMTGQNMGGMMGHSRVMGQQSANSGTPGAQVFATSCAVCHNADSTAKKVGPGLKGLYREAKLSDGKKVTDENVRKFLQTNHPGMPSFANTLTKQQTDQLIAYLKTL